MILIYWGFRVFVGRNMLKTEQFELHQFKLQLPIFAQRNIFQRFQGILSATNAKETTANRLATWGKRTYRKNYSRFRATTKKNNNKIISDLPKIDIKSIGFALLSFFLFYFLGLRKPKLIAGLFGWSGPNYLLGTQETVLDSCRPSLWPTRRKYKQSTMFVGWHSSSGEQGQTINFSPLPRNVAPNRNSASFLIWRTDLTDSFFFLYFEVVKARTSTNAKWHLGTSPSRHVKVNLCGSCLRNGAAVADLWGKLVWWQEYARKTSNRSATLTFKLEKTGQLETSLVIFFTLGLIKQSHTHSPPENRI